VQNSICNSWQLSLSHNNTDINYLPTTIPFNICCIESLQCISCLILRGNFPITYTGPLHFFWAHTKKFLPKMTSTYECLVSALLVKDLLEHCMASCLALLYIEITSYYYYTGLSEQWQQTIRQILHKYLALPTIVNNNYCSDGVVQVFMCLPRVYSNIIDCLPHYQECSLVISALYLLLE